MNDALFVLSVAVIGIIAFILVFEHHYEDGVIGRAALGIVALMSISVVFSEIAGDRYGMPPEVTWLLVGVAIFMARHYYRFLCYTKFGRYIWTGIQRPNDSMEDRTCPRSPDSAGS